MRPYGNGKGGGEDPRRPGRADSPRLRDARRTPPKDGFGESGRRRLRAGGPRSRERRRAGLHADRNDAPHGMEA